MAPMDAARMIEDRVSAACCWTLRWSAMMPYVQHDDDSMNVSFRSEPKSSTGLEAVVNIEAKQSRGHTPCVTS